MCGRKTLKKSLTPRPRLKSMDSRELYSAQAHIQSVPAMIIIWNNKNVRINSCHLILIHPAKWIRWYVPVGVRFCEPMDGVWVCDNRSTNVCCQFSLCWNNIINVYIDRKLFVTFNLSTKLAVSPSLSVSISLLLSVWELRVTAKSTMLTGISYSSCFALDSPPPAPLLFSHPHIHAKLFSI